MLKRIARVAVLASSLVVVAAPLTPPVAAAASATPVYTQADSGKTENVAYHTDFKVRLRVCEDCGYRWSFAQRPDRKIIKLIRRTDVSSAKPPAVGGINTVTWTYEAVGHGKTTMKLVQKSPGGKVSKRFSLTIRVPHGLPKSG